MVHPVNDHALDLIFRNGRSHNLFLDKPVPEVLIRAVYDLAKMGPTSANCSPARFVFVNSADAKERLLVHMSEGNREKTRSAPWTVIIAQDMRFAEKIPALFPHLPQAQHWFDAITEETAFRNASLQGAYLMLAARALGLDCGPMSGFDKAGVKKEFFSGEGQEEDHWQANFVCNIGYGDHSKVFERLPRLAFEEACRIV